MDILKPKIDYITLCDSVVQDQQGKKTFYGLFDRIASNKLPFSHQQFHVAIRLEDGRGKHKIEIQIIHSDGTLVFKTPEVPVEFSGPLGVVEFVAVFQGFQFNKDGFYKIIVLLDGQVLEEKGKRFLIEKVG